MKYVLYISCLKGVKLKAVSQIFWTAWLYLDVFLHFLPSRDWSLHWWLTQIYSAPHRRLHWMLSLGYLSLFSCSCSPCVSSRLSSFLHFLSPPPSPSWPRLFLHSLSFSFLIYPAAWGEQRWCLADRQFKMNLWSVVVRTEKLKKKIGSFLSCFK